jgi:dTDP-glucose 4,6-dehydratase
MRVLITGGAGFIGTNLTRYWADQHPKDELVVLDKLTYAGRSESLRDLIDSRRIRLVVGDITNSDLVGPLVRQSDIVLHLAAESAVDRSIEGSRPFVTTNVLGTQTLLDAARKADVRRFHHVSTDEVFGSLDLGGTNRFSPTSSYAPRNPYAATKAGSDHLVDSYFHTYGLNVTLSYCGNNYGPYQHPEKLIPRVITYALSGKKIPVYGQGRNVRDWIFVRDHCAALDRIVTNGRPGERYTIGADCQLENLEIVRRILKLVGVPDDRIEFVSDRAGHDARYALDASKIRSDLGWTPQVDIGQGLRETVDWYQGNRRWWESLQTA